MTAREAIVAADAILPGSAAPDGQPDFRWRAIIRVGEFVESNPDEVCDFVLRWGSHEDEDLRNAIATCLLEHLLEHHFDRVVPRIEERIRKDAVFRSMCRTCWPFGDAEGASRRLTWRMLVEPG